MPRPRRNARIILSICLVSIAANAQNPFHFGIVTGVPLSDTLSSINYFAATASSLTFDSYNSKTKRLLIGPVVGVDLQRGLGIEFDALYQRVNYDHASQTVSGFLTVGTNSVPASSSSQSFEQATANRWQFPLLVQYRRTLWKTSLFAEAGPSMSRLANARSTIQFASVNGSGSSSGTTTLTSSGGTWAGVTAGGGLDLRLFHGHLRPEFRYSHWFVPAGSATVTTGVLAGFATATPIVSPSFRVNQDEASFLLGLTF
jgi:hypothetical protein